MHMYITWNEVSKLYIAALQHITRQSTYDTCSIITLKIARERYMYMTNIGIQVERPPMYMYIPSASYSKNSNSDRYMRPSMQLNRTVVRPAHWRLFSPNSSEAAVYSRDMRA